MPRPIIGQLLLVGLSLLMLSGCVKWGPSPEEAKAAYEIEVQKLESIDAQIVQLQENIKESLRKRKESEDIGEAIAAFKVDGEDKKQIDALQKEVRHNVDKVAHLSSKMLKDLKRLRAEQQIRVAEARRRKDAAK